MKFILSIAEGSRDISSTLWKNFKLFEEVDTDKSLIKIYKESANLVQSSDKKD